MLSSLVFLLSAVVSLAQCSGTKGIYHSPKAESFMVVDVKSTLPTNVTTPAVQRRALQLYIECQND